MLLGAAVESEDARAARKAAQSGPAKAQAEHAETSLSLAHNTQPREAGINSATNKHDVNTDNRDVNAPPRTLGSLPLGLAAQPLRTIRLMVLRRPRHLRQPPPLLLLCGK